MRLYKNISSATTTTLVAKEAGFAGGSISKVTIANHDDSDSNVIQLHLYDGSNTYVIAETTIPPRVTLVLQDNITFDNSVYNLRLVTSSTADTTVKIK